MVVVLAGISVMGGDSWIVPDLPVVGLVELAFWGKADASPETIEKGISAGRLCLQAAVEIAFREQRNRKLDWASLSYRRLHISSLVQFSGQSLYGKYLVKARVATTPGSG